MHISMNDLILDDGVIRDMLLNGDLPEVGISSNAPLWELAFFLVQIII